VQSSYFDVHVLQYGSDEFWSAKNTIILLLRQRQSNILSALNHSAMLPAVPGEGGGTLGISGWGCAAGTLEPLTYT